MRPRAFPLLLLFAIVPALRAATVSDDVLRSLATGARVRVIVALRAPAAQGKSGIAATEAIRSVESRVIAAIEGDSFRVTDRWDSVPGFAGELEIGALSALADDPDVLRVDEDRGGSAHLAESVPLVGGKAVHDLGFYGEGVTVAVVDSGVDSTHPDLQGAVVDERCFCTSLNYSGCCPNGQTMQSGPGSALDGAGHGTAVASTIASRGRIAALGMAPKAKIVAVRVLDDANRFAYDSQIVSGLDFLLMSHPEVRVVNLSLGTDALYSGACDNQNAELILWKQQIAAFRARGTAVVVSTGNNANINAIGAPACVPGAWAVGATYDASFASAQFSSCSEAAVRADDVACFSNSSSQVGFVAPGAYITASAAGGTTRRVAGTSFAAPHVAGAAALLLGMKPSATVGEIESVLTRTGKSVTDQRNQRVFPRIDVLQAVKELQKTPVPPPVRRRVAPHE